MKIAKNIISVLIIIMIIFGIFMAVTKGINTGILYTEREQIGIFINSQFDITDIRKIAKDVFKDEDYILQKATIFEDTVIIQNEEITNEEKEQIVIKLNEKYGLDIKNEDITVEKIDARSLKEDLGKYILPSCISLILVIVYFAFRFKKLGCVRTNVRFVTTIIFAELLYLSILSISQIEIGRLLAPVAFMIYILCTIVATAIFEKERTDLILNDNK